MIHIWESQDPVMDENKGIGSLYLSDLTSTWTTIPELIDLSNQFNAILCLYVDCFGYRFKS